jgi:hypothetical protein
MRIDRLSALHPSPSQANEVQSERIDSNSHYENNFVQPHSIESVKDSEPLSSSSAFQAEPLIV